VRLFELPFHLPHCYLFDQLSSVVRWTDSNGTLVSTYQYDPYGNLLSSTGSVANPWRFAGGYFDSSTGLYKFGTRYYNPGFGRWSQQDPLRGQLNDPTSLNRYLYAGDDPVNFTDPGGRDDIFTSCIWIWFFAAIGMIAGIGSLYTVIANAWAASEAAITAAIAAGTVGTVALSDGTVALIGLMALELTPPVLTFGFWFALVFGAAALVGAAWALAYAIVHCVLHTD
jgi:RHS repeat-associated protein